MKKYFFNRINHKIFLLIVLYGYLNALTAQSLYNKEFQLTSDNDSYTMRGKDGYYTNGLKIAFRWKNKKDTSSRVIRSIELGQLMYNAKNGSYKKLSEMDRPVTAFLYASYLQTYFNKKETVWQWGATLGVIGPPAFGKQVQDAIHSSLNMYKPEEWSYQLKTEWGMNMQAQWSPEFNGFGKHFIIKPIAGAILGNTFTNANIGAAMLLGNFNTNSETVFWNANLNGNSKESFFYFYPQIILKAYDATVQGGLFRHDKGNYIGKLNRCVFMPRIGWMYSNHCFLLHLALSHESRESLTQQETQWYGTISLGFVF